MVFHFGKTELLGFLRFISDGYWFQRNTEPAQFSRYHTPRAIDFKILSLWGVSWSGCFIGIMRLAEPKEAATDTENDTSVIKNR